jgi:hypothetical protein
VELDDSGYKWAVIDEAGNVSIRIDEGVWPQREFFENGYAVLRGGNETTILDTGGRRYPISRHIKRSARVSPAGGSLFFYAEEKNGEPINGTKGIFAIIPKGGDLNAR